MAFKTTPPDKFATAMADEPRTHAPRTQDIDIEIRDLVAGNGPGTFTLLNVPVIDVDWPKVAEILIAAGVPDRTAREYADEFADTVFRKEIARILADRMTRY